MKKLLLVVLNVICVSAFAQNLVVINELMADNDTVQADQDGEFDDWIELYNNADISIDLSGYYLTDDINDLTQWTFPEGTTIAAGAYLIVWADDDGDQTGLHANFKLSSGGEAVILSDNFENILDQIEFPNQVVDVAYGRIPNGTGDFEATIPTFNATNQALNEDLDIVINELMANNISTQADQDGEYDTWIELYNNTVSLVDLSGFYLSDNSNNLNQWTFPEGTTIETGDYLIVWLDNDTDQEGLHANFSLSSSGGDLYLSNSMNAPLDQVTYASQSEGVSYSRLPNGTGTFAASSPTYDSYNLALPASSELVINEFMASNTLTQADQDGEFDDWIELFNNGNSEMNLSGYGLSDDASDLNQWTFPEGTTIAAGAYLIVWADNDVDQEGLHANFKLSGGGETIILSNDMSTVLDVITYTDQTSDTTWSRIPNGTGSFQESLPTYNTENQSLTNIVDLLGQDIELSLYPNPTNSEFKISIKEDFPIERNLNVYNLNGNLIYQSNIYQEKYIITNHWQTGIYIVQIEDVLIKLIVE